MDDQLHLHAEFKPKHDVNHDLHDAPPAAAATPAAAGASVQAVIPLLLSNQQPSPSVGGNGRLESKSKLCMGLAIAAVILFLIPTIVASIALAKIKSYESKGDYSCSDLRAEFMSELALTNQQLTNLTYQQYKTTVVYTGGPPFYSQYPSYAPLPLSTVIFDPSNCWNNRTYTYEAAVRGAYLMTFAVGVGQPPNTGDSADDVVLTLTSGSLVKFPICAGNSFSGQDGWTVTVHCTTVWNLKEGDTLQLVYGSTNSKAYVYTLMGASLSVHLLSRDY